MHCVVIGNGMVGHRFCERIAELDPDGKLQLTVFGDEPRPAYDRVHLSDFFAGRGPEELMITSLDWYSDRGFDLRVGQAVVEIDCARSQVVTVGGARVDYDRLVLATGSAPFVPPIPGVELPGVFVYRTIDDLGGIRAWAQRCRRGVVIGGGLLGLEAAKGLLDLGLETHVVEFADRLMPRQIDEEGGALLRRSIREIGVEVHLGAGIEALMGEDRIERLAIEAKPDLEADLVIISAGIRPRDELARACGLEVGERGGIVVNDRLETSDPRVSAIGECALHAGVLYGLVAPGYEMADVAARRLIDSDDAAFTGSDLSTQLKVLGVDVASFGDPFADRADPEAVRSVVIQDAVRGSYQKIILDPEGQRLLGGVLVGDVAPYSRLLQLAREATPIEGRARELLADPGLENVAALSDDAQVCSCNSVTKGDLLAAISDGADSLGALKACTKAGSGCGGCLPALSQVLQAELTRCGRSIDDTLCEHFAYTRQELFWIVKLGRNEKFDALLDSHGKGDGCEVCRPAVASILASVWNDLVLNHESVQDTNDRFLANIQRGGTYSVIPRVPGGEITPEKLVVLGNVAKKYDLYCKITGGQRIDLLGARVDELPAIWAELVDAGFESGHAYGKAMRTVKSCVGSTWCRFGVQDSTAFAIRIEERYRGIRAPHKLKSAVSGCIRECAEAQNKDFGIIATETGWNLYLCGNGGSKPRHGDLVATDLRDDELIRIVDRFLMFYIQTAKPLQRTARWLEDLEGGIEYLKQVILNDVLGIADQLEHDMQQLVDLYRCEWKQVVEDPELRARFRHHAETADPDDGLAFVRERGQRRPADWVSPEEATAPLSTEQQWTWQRMAEVSEIPTDGGMAVRYGATQIAIFHFARRDAWYATQNHCPHRRDNVLARGLLGDVDGEPKVICPLHKKTFSLQTGKGLSDPAYSVQTFPVRVEGNEVLVKLPPADALADASFICTAASSR